ncbi:MAG: NAD(P)-binding protein [Bacteroidales bacterium]|nr:NAD(P)-binding protein [Bacteroidales bacterium]
MPRKYDYLIVGAGLFGATFARVAADSGRRCLVIDKRPHAGGNTYCEQIEGINVHRYGAHIFHTSDRKVWDFVNRYVEFNRFTNSPIAIAPDGRLYNLPFNLNTFAQMWGIHTPAEAQAILTRQRAVAQSQLRASSHPSAPSVSQRTAGEVSLRQDDRMAPTVLGDSTVEPRNLEEQALSLVGRDIYEQLIKGYTEKQWGRPCTELPAFIIKRLPVRMTFDNNYFNDLYQGIPIGGYNRLTSALLDGIEVRLNTDFFADRAHWESVADTILYTGPIDQYFDYCYGHLEYRTLRFETEVLDTPNYQGNAVVNYTSALVPYTRIIEHKHFEAFGPDIYANPHTVITREYPSEWHGAAAPRPAEHPDAHSVSQRTPAKFRFAEPYYPINDARNQALYAKYRALADTISSRVLFGGRLAEYRYYDMAPTIAAALRLFATHIPG